MTRVMAVANQKGGVGKTVTAINLASELARQGRRVLLLDLDPQGHCGIGLGFDIESVERTTYELLTDKSLEIGDCRIVVDLDGLDGRLHVVPANLKLSLAERELERAYSLPNLVLARKLKAVRDRYDDIVLDCPPALSKLTLNAFLASNLVIIPISVSYFSIQGVRMLAETLRDIFEETGLDYEIRCLITRYHARQTVSKEVHDAALELFGDYCFETLIRDSVEVEKSVGAQLPLYLFNRSSGAARDYRDLAEEIIELGQSPEEQAAAALQPAVSVDPVIESVSAEASRSEVSKSEDSKSEDSGPTEPVEARP